MEIVKICAHGKRKIVKEKACFLLNDYCCFPRIFIKNPVGRLCRPAQITSKYLIPTAGKPSANPDRPFRNCGVQGNHSPAGVRGSAPETPPQPSGAASRKLLPQPCGCTPGMAVQIINPGDLLKLCSQQRRKLPRLIIPAFQHQPAPMM